MENYAALAHLGQISRARVTQIMNLLQLAPEIQEDILLGDTPAGGLRESAVRKIGGVVLWSEQRDRWQALLRAASAQKAPGGVAVIVK